MERTEEDSASVIEEARGRLWTVLAWCGALSLFILAVAVSVRSIEGNLTADLTAQGGALWDFRDASYFSVTAMFDRIVPYDVSAYFAAYPVAQEFPLLPPAYLVLHAPFQLVAFPTAATMMVAINMLGLVALSAWCLSLARYRVRPLAVLAASSLVMLSSGGRNVLFSGQSSLVFTAGAYLAMTAIHAYPGSIGLFIALVKPSFGLPVGALLLAAGRWRRVVYASTAAFVVSLVLMLPFVAWSGGLDELTDTFADNAVFSAASEWVALETTTARIDVAATIAMLFDWVPSNAGEIALGIAVIVVAGGVMWSRRSILFEGNNRDALVVLVSLATLLGVYHSHYDLVLLVLPTILVTRRDFAGGSIPPVLRRGLLGVLLFASFNPFRIDQVMGALTDSLRIVRIMSPGLTGLSLLAAFVLAIVVIRRLGVEVSDHSVRTGFDAT